MKNKLLLINSLSAGGAEKVMSVLANQLSKDGYQIHIVCLEKNDFYKINSNIKVTYLSDFKGDESPKLKLLYIPYFAYKLAKIIKENNIILIQSHLYRSNYINILAKFFGAKHNIQIVTAGRISRYLELGFNGKINLFLIKNLYPKADLLILKAKGMEIDMQKLFNFPNEKVVINNPYNLNEIKKLSNEEVNEFDFYIGNKYIVSVGRLIELKRNKDLLYALSKINNEKYEIVFLGDGNQKDILIQIAKKLNIEKKVHFLGKVSNPYKFMKRSDIFVNSSESEGFPNVLVEAMACGLPVVSSDCTSGPREILAPSTDVEHKLKHGFEIAEYGILYGTNDIDALIQAITLLDSDKTLYQKYVDSGNHRINDFSVDKIVKQYKEVLEIE